jgi:hypothetical protein
MYDVADRSLSPRFLLIASLAPEAVFERTAAQSSRSSNVHQGVRERLKVRFSIEVAHGATDPLHDRLANAHTSSGRTRIARTSGSGVIVR